MCGQGGFCMKAYLISQAFPNKPQLKSLFFLKQEFAPWPEIQDRNVDKDSQ